MKKSPLIVVFTTVMLDLIGFGMVIPLIALYGLHFGASAFQLGILGAAFSLLQFFFSPFWGALSDRIGRRPVLLISLAGSTLSYLLFGLAQNYWWLLISRACGGIFAANIATAQAYIADVTPKEERARGMGLIGAAFGIGFTLGPPLGGIAGHYLGLGAPGLIAALVCGLNLLLAFIRLPESLPPEKRHQGSNRSLLPLSPEALRMAFGSALLGGLIMVFFFSTLAISNMEQAFSPFLSYALSFDTADAALGTGMVLMWMSLLGAIVQGGLIKHLVKRYGEWRLLSAGLACFSLGMLLFPLCPGYGYYFALAFLLAVGSGLSNPALSALISHSVDASRQGMVFGLTQGLASLARAVGPFSGLLLFSYWPGGPFYLGALILALAFVFTLRLSR